MHIRIRSQTPTPAFAHVLVSFYVRKSMLHPFHVPFGADSLASLREVSADGAIMPLEFFVIVPIYDTCTGGEHAASPSSTF